MVRECIKDGWGEEYMGTDVEPLIRLSLVNLISVGEG